MCVWTSIFGKSGTACGLAASVPLASTATTGAASVSFRNRRRERRTSGTSSIHRNRRDCHQRLRRRGLIVAKHEVQIVEAGGGLQRDRWGRRGRRWCGGRGAGTAAARGRAGGDGGRGGSHD